MTTAKGFALSPYVEIFIRGKAFSELPLPQQTAAFTLYAKLTHYFLCLQLIPASQSDSLP